ncbi:STAS domain-containing protein [Arsenicibacter rosenii]|uniref:Anti-anti-sigma factor n=1 Tax=Arsenicibacter rosenii TaxID=1750698 RepID=A0A1S2VQL1_9BACT|nr:STAS domain-containing protein [Arsenicibacter rosenii]OIN61034.1 anti-anti-sigma factor [Arsenicibacter rosenii]
MQHQMLALLRSKKPQILERWIQHQLTLDTLRDDLISNDELREQSEGIVNLIVDQISEQTLALDPYALEPILEYLSGIAISRARHGFSPRETSFYLFSLKNAMLDMLAESAGSDIAALYDMTRSLGRFFDELSTSTFETFIKGREEVILRQTDEIAEISTPVIRVWDQILAMPLIGTLDSARTQVVMENLLQAIVDTGSEIAILDISGVPAVDSLVAQHLIKTVSATRLMGAECIISGIRPEIAQTVVQLGIDLSQVITKATLASALKSAFSMLKLEVRKTQSQKPFLI